MQIDIGKTIAGKYELVRLIGQGAMGEVWLATHKTLGGEFAIKLADPSELDGDDSVAGRFQLEAQLSAKFSRKTRHVVSVSDHGEEGGLAYLVMELLDGEGLDARLTRTGPLSVAETSVIVSQIARALAVAHAEETFHRDLKPANVFLTRDEDGRLLVKVFDFGIARTRKPFQTDSPFSTSKDMVLGTPSYMSPEQARGLKTLDHRCDVWALAVLAYEALTGNIPWDGETVEEVFLAVCTFRATPILERRADLPEGIAAIFAKAFAPKIGDRFATAIEFAAALQDLCSTDALEGAGARANTLLQRPSEASLPLIDVGSGDWPSVPSGVAVGENTERSRKAYRERKKGAALLPWLVLLLLVGGVGAGVVLTRSSGGEAKASSATLPPPSAAAEEPTPAPSPLPEATAAPEEQAPAPVATAPEPAPKASASTNTAPRPRAGGAVSTATATKKSASSQVPAAAETAHKPPPDKSNIF